MHQIDFRKYVRDVDVILSPWKECRPKILIVTDGLSYSATDGFGLTQFVQTLASSTIHGMTPQIVKASRGFDPNADIQNFDFTNATTGLLKSRYDVVFLFGIASEGSNQLPQTQVDAISRFMQAGGGVFATGDHESLGASMSRDVPRVRNMRFWRQVETPDASDTTRLTTNLPGTNNVYEFDDQSDIHPQRLYVNYRTQTGGVGNPHPLLQTALLGPVEVFPDHPHEGECRIPENLTTTFQLDGATPDEWPTASGGGARVAPEMVALTMSHGDSFPGKQAVVPRSFISIAAYNGHLAKVGRVATDATWHHFVNINIDGTGSPRSGLQNPPGVDTPDMQRIRQYYRNLATWLMPQNVRRCLRFPWIVLEVRKYPLFEELHIPHIEHATGEDFHQIGRQVAAALAAKYPRYQVDELIADALEDGVGPERAAKLRALEDRCGRTSAKDLGAAALGALTVATIMKLADVKAIERGDIHDAFATVAEDSSVIGIRKYLEVCRKDFEEAEAALDVAVPVTA